MIRLGALLLSGLLLAGCASVEERQRYHHELAMTNLKLGVGYLRQGRLDLALEKLRKAEEAEPDLAPVHTSLALVYQQKGELELAERYFRRALELDPRDGGTHNNYAVLLCNLRRFEAAEKEFLIALKSPGYKTPATVYENLGVCAMRAADLDKAERHFRRALQIDPRMPISLLNMAEISLAKKRYLSGRAYLQRYLEVGPHTPRSLWLGIRIERKLGDEEAVRDYAARLRRQFPDSDEMGRLMEMEEAARGGSR